MTDYIFWSGGPDSTAGLITMLEEGLDVTALTAMSSGAGMRREDYIVFASQTSAVLHMMERLRAKYENFSWHPLEPNPWCVLRPVRGEEALDVCAEWMKGWMSRNMTEDDFLYPWVIGPDNDTDATGRFARIAATDHRIQMMSFTLERMKQALGDFLSLTWSCPKPHTFGVPCGYCVKCQKQTDLRRA